MVECVCARSVTRPVGPSICSGPTQGTHLRGCFSLSQQEAPLLDLEQPTEVTHLIGCTIPSRWCSL